MEVGENLTLSSCDNLEGCLDSMAGSNLQSADRAYVIDSYRVMIL
jgi:hypothetical protein